MKRDEGVFLEGLAEEIIADSSSSVGVGGLLLALVLRPPVGKLLPLLGGAISGIPPRNVPEPCKVDGGEAHPDRIPLIAPQSSGWREGQGGQMEERREGGELSLATLAYNAVGASSWMGAVKVIARRGRLVQVSATAHCTVLSHL